MWSSLGLRGVRFLLRAPCPSPGPAECPHSFIIVLFPRICGTVCFTLSQCTCKLKTVIQLLSLQLSLGDPVWAWFLTLHLAYQIVQIRQGLSCGQLAGPFRKSPNYRCFQILNSWFASRKLRESHFGLKLFLLGQLSLPSQKSCEI